MSTKSLLLIGATLTLATAAFAQTQTNDRGEALQKQLEQRAIKIPKSPPRSAASEPNSEESRDAGATERSATISRQQVRSAQVVRRAPDWRAVRDTLDTTSTNDGARSGANQTQTEELSAGPPPPGGRALASERFDRPGLRAARSTSMSDDLATETARVEAPVLIPATLARRDDFKIYGMRNVYTATASLDEDASISISGTCNRVIGGDPDIVSFRKRLSEAPPRLPALGADYHISRNDFGIDLSFSKFGCGYVITVECGDPGADPRCTGDDYITELADSMILVNAERAESEQ